MRGFTILRFLRDRNISANVVLRLDDELARAVRGLEIGQCEIAPLHAPVAHDARYDYCFLDQYTYDRKSILDYQAVCSKLIVFDELAQIDFFDLFRDRDTVVRAQLLERSAQVKNARCLVLNGLSYFVINRSYPDVNAGPEQKVVDLLILLGGGAGHESIYRRLVETLSQRYPDNSINVRLILGANASRESLATLGRILPNALVEGYVPDPVSVMRASRVGIMSGGYSKYEAAYAGLPSTLLAVQDHQVGIARSFCEAGGGVYAGDGRSPSAIDDAISHALTMLHTPELAQTVSARASSLIDGQGLDRVFDMSAAL